MLNEYAETSGTYGETALIGQVASQNLAVGGSEQINNYDQPKNNLSQIADRGRLPFERDPATTPQTGQIETQTTPQNPPLRARRVKPGHRFVPLPPQYQQPIDTNNPGGTTTPAPATTSAGGVTTTPATTPAATPAADNLIFGYPANYVYLAGGAAAIAVIYFMTAKK